MEINNQNTQYWLMKTEPDVFSWDDLLNSPHQTTVWEGVRNYQARNFMMKDMKVNDLVLFYHSSCQIPGIQGIARVASQAFPDPTALVKDSPYYDPKPIAAGQSARWFAVKIQFYANLVTPVPLSFLKTHPDLRHMQVCQRGSRLSIQPVSREHFQRIVQIPQ